MLAGAAPSAQDPFPWSLQFGALPLKDGSVRFRVWAPNAVRLSVQILDEPALLALLETTAQPTEN